MKKFNDAVLTSLFLSSTMLATVSNAGHHEGDKAKEMAKTSEICQGYGPQTPRDIDQLDGDNKVKFQLAGESSGLNLCNIHFHNNAELKSKAFSIYAGEGQKGDGGGYQCGISTALSEAELKAPSAEIC